MQGPESTYTVKKYVETPGRRPEMLFKISMKIGEWRRTNVHILIKGERLNALRFRQVSLTSTVFKLLAI